MMSGRLFVWFQHVLPQHALSRLVLHATRVRAPWFKNALIKGFLKRFAIDMTEAVQPEPLRYASFNEFFTRALKPEARAIAREPHEIACPVDGAISEVGKIDGASLLQAKGRQYTLGELLAAQLGRRISRAALSPPFILRRSTTTGCICRSKDGCARPSMYPAACSASMPSRHRGCRGSLRATSEC